MEKFLETKNIVAIILSLLAITAAATYKYFDNAQENYSTTVTKTYLEVSGVKNDLTTSATNLSANGAENFIQTLNTSKEILSNEVKKLNAVEVPEKFSDDHRKVVECLKTEYNLIDRLKENLSIQNEYEAVDNFAKSKELFKNLKEQSTFLSVDRNNFDEVFELSAVGEKIENYLNGKKQLRYDKDQKEQAEREKAAAAERERIEREKQKKFHKTLTMTAEEFRNFYNQNASALPEGDKIKITGVQSDFIPFDKSYVYIFYNKSGFDLVETSYENRVDGFLIANRTSASNYSGNFFWTMLVAAHTLCNENFISNVEDLKEIKQVIVMLMNRINKNNTEVSTYYNGKKFTFCKSSDESLFIVGN